MGEPAAPQSSQMLRLNVRVQGLVEMEHTAGYLNTNLNELAYFFFGRENLKKIYLSVRDNSLKSAPDTPLKIARNKRWPVSYVI
jgi:hypothetical protein